MRKRTKNACHHNRHVHLMCVTAIHIAGSPVDHGAREVILTSAKQQNGKGKQKRTSIESKIMVPAQRRLLALRCRMLPYGAYFRERMPPISSCHAVMTARCNGRWPAASATCLSDTMSSITWNDNKIKRKRNKRHDWLANRKRRKSRVYK